MSIPDLCQERAVLKVIADEVERRRGAVNEKLGAAFAETGTTQAPATLPDGTKVGTVSYAGVGGKAAVVVDENAFLAWVLENYPDEVVTRVREDSKKKWLDGAKAAGKPIDTRTGEVIPGVEIVDSQPYVALRFARGGAEAIIAAWLAGRLDVPLLEAPAIGAGGAS